MAKHVNDCAHVPEIICLSSGKGGVGKTSLTVNLAAAFVKKRKRVLVVDADLGLANIDILLGLNVKHTVQEALEQGAPLLDILVEHEGFYILPASSGVPEMANLSYEDQAYLTSSLEEVINDFDFVLVDCAAGVGESVLWFNQWAHSNIIILTPDPTSMTDAYALGKILATKYDKNSFQLVINNVKSNKEGLDVYQNMVMVFKNFLKIEPGLLGIIPTDQNVAQAIRKQSPFVLGAPSCKASVAIFEIVDKLI
nr:MinD/ParA family protein [Desulfobulbaceae bacterium]